MSGFTHDAVRLTVDDGIATITLARADGFDKVDAVLLEGLGAVLDHLQDQPLAGIVLTGANRDFCVGADLEMLLSTHDPAAMLQATGALHAITARLEAGPPVVAALNGSALGGGYELALACHHRIVVDAPHVRVGLPEVMLGVIPGGGGTQRLPRLIGLQPALDLLLQGKTLRAAKAKTAGLVDAVAPDHETLLQEAQAWIRASPEARQPWADKRFRWPGIRPGSADARNLFLGAAAMVYRKTAGAFPAAETALSVVQEGAAVPLERALEIEARAFARLATSASAKAMIRTLFFHKNAADKQKGLPRVEDPGIRKVAVLGAGMMGAGIAFLSAQAGFDVVLKDISTGSLDRGMAHVERQIGRLKHLDDAAREALRARITPSVALSDVEGADLVIEAVFEDLDLKHRVIREVEPLLADDALFASNTSALPITDLAGASRHPERFIGLHFFSPVEKMPLLEVITSSQTDERTLARALAFARALRKTTIVVNDGYGFYTTRVFSSYILEGAQLVAEGYDPVVVDWAARSAGMVVGPLQVFDEVTLTLGVHAMAQAEQYLGITSTEGAALVRRLVEAGRLGKAHGAGFYTYVNGRRSGIWDGLDEVVGVPRKRASLDVLGERLLLAQVAEVGRALDAGILNNPRDAEVGAILGIGFAPNTGGPLSWADQLGLPTLVARLDELAEQFGDRFTPARTFREMAEEGKSFFG